MRGRDVAAAAGGWRVTWALDLAPEQRRPSRPRVDRTELTMLVQAPRHVATVTV